MGKAVVNQDQTGEFRKHSSIPWKKQEAASIPIEDWRNSTGYNYPVAGDKEHVSVDSESIAEDDRKAETLSALA